MQNKMLQIECDQTVGYDGIELIPQIPAPAPFEPIQT